MTMVSPGEWTAIVACAVLAYLCGSIPFGLLLAHAGGHGDIRAIGSGNIGATNVLRTGNKKLAAATLLCDVLKGVAPVAVAWHFGAETAAVAAVFAPLGHIFPVWLGFKGGKGVATAGGALLAYAWPVALAAIATLARGRVPLSLLVARRGGRHRHGTGLCVVNAPDRHFAGAGRADRRTRRMATSHQHHAPGSRQRRQNRLRKKARLRRHGQTVRVDETIGPPSSSAAMPAPRTLNPAERLDWLRLIRSENVGPVTFYQLLSRFGSAEAALAALPEIAHRGGRARALTICPRATAERELQQLHAAGSRFVAWGEPDYPAALAALDDAPPLISVKGDTTLFARNALAIVGARNASANGRRFARDIALQLGQQGLLVVSGLARGIDGAAHDGALATGTVAVVAGGIDQVYPEENRALHEQIAERGVIVAEMPVGTEPQARHFPRRNRIISGCALGVLVVEAALRSGSLITARFALEQGRDVFAVPGSPLDPRCRGTNDLIRNGAILTAIRN